MERLVKFEGKLDVFFIKYLVKHREGCLNCYGWSSNFMFFHHFFLVDDCHFGGNNHPLEAHNMTRFMDGWTPTELPPRFSSYNLKALWNKSNGRVSTFEHTIETSFSISYQPSIGLGFSVQGWFLAVYMYTNGREFRMLGKCSSSLSFRVRVLGYTWMRGLQFLWNWIWIETLWNHLFCWN
jgi:hypothetical protein